LKPDGSTDKEVAAWVDSIVTCHKPKIVPDTTVDTASKTPATIVARNVHKHSFTCRGKKKSSKKKYNPLDEADTEALKSKARTKCRFHVPLPPLRDTMVLRPYEDQDERNMHKKNWTKIQELLARMYEAQLAAPDALDTITFDSFLADLGLSEDEYIAALRHSVTSTRILLKRAPHEIRVNQYNDFILATWEANMVDDIFFSFFFPLFFILRNTKGR
jgi:hypothetical protein